MKSRFHTAAAIFLASLMVMAVGACSSSSSPTAEDGISSLKGIDGAFDESGSDGVHPDTWENNHQGLSQGDLADCISCHAGTSVDEQGCLPCHTGSDKADDEAYDEVDDD